MLSHRRNHFSADLIRSNFMIAASTRQNLFFFSPSVAVFHKYAFRNVDTESTTTELSHDKVIFWDRMVTAYAKPSDSLNKYTF